MLARIILAGLLAAFVVLSGCATPSSSTSTSSVDSDEDDESVNNNPLVKVVETEDPAAMVLHLLQAPEASTRAVKASEPVRSPFEGTGLAGTSLVSWEFQLNQSMVPDGNWNWTVWVEVPEGMYGNPISSCPWDFTVAVRTERSSSSYGTFVEDCQTDSGPAVPGVRLLRGSLHSAWQAGETLPPGAVISLDVTCSLITLGGEGAVALGGAPGRDSQIHVGLRAKPGTGV